MSATAEAGVGAGAPGRAASRMRFVDRAEVAADDSGCVAIANDVDVETIASRLPATRVVALAFPKWTDGRAYSQARLLRARHRFAGEIRATGDVTADMLPLLQRCGFDAVVLREGQSVETAERALGFFPDGHYQGDALEPLPRFRREGAGA